MGAATGFGISTGFGAGGSAFYNVTLDATASTVAADLRLSTICGNETMQVPTAPVCAAAPAPLAERACLQGPGADALLLCGLPDEPPFRRQSRAVEVIAAVGHDGKSTQPGLLPFLAHEDGRVRAKAVDALASLDSKSAPDAVPALARHLAVETDPGAAGTIADALEKNASPAFVPVLRDALRRFTAPPHENADAALFTLTALEACLHAGTPDPAVTDRVVGDVGLLTASPSLLVRRTAERFLQRLGRRPGPFSAVDPPLWPAAPSTLPARATVRTAKGDVVIRLYREDAPLTVTNFLRLARQGFYRGLVFHRVVPDFVVQGGDPRGDGNGGPGYAIPCEVNPRPYHRGVVGMALSGKDSGGSQFFITHAPQPHLDGRYTAFGEVERGMEVVDAILESDVVLDVVVGP